MNDPKTVFIDAELWKNGESKFFDMVTTIPKGANLIVEGELVGDEWVDKTTGQKRQKLKIAINKIHFLDKKSDSTQEPSTEPSDEADIPF